MDPPEEEEGAQAAAATAHLFFKNDLVSALDDPSKVGTILRTSTTSDSDSDTDSEPDLPPAHSLVAWSPSADPVQTPNSNLALLDRRFSHGDVVVSTSAPLSQSGFISKLHLFADIRYQSPNLTWESPNLNSTELRRVRPLMEGDYVIRHHWLGRVDDVVDNVTLAFQDGAECKVTRADPDTLVCDQSEETDPMSYYFPGAVVREFPGSSTSVLRRAMWTAGRWRPDRREATVTRVDTSYVVVTWLSGARSSSPRPAEEQKPQDLVRLPRFSHVEWDVGDYTLPDAKQTTAVTKRPRVVNLSRKRRKPAVIPYSGVVVCTKTYADVVWQDGTRSLEVPTTSLQNSGPFNFNEFWPESYVVESVGEGEVARVGVVKTVDAKQRTARVKWCKPVRSPEDMREFEGEETVSIFELADHPDYRYNLGDIVVRLSPSGQPLAVEEEEEEEEDLSWVGTIVGYEDGDVEVEWADGVVSRVGPQAIFVVHRPQDDESSDDDDDDEDDARSWETVDSEEKVRLLEVEETDQPNGLENAEEGSSFHAGTMSFVSGLAARLVTALLGLRERGAVPEPVVENGPSAEPSENGPSAAEEEAPGDEGGEGDEADGPPVEDEKFLPASSTLQEVSASIKQFDVVTDASDHFFSEKADSDVQSRKWLRTVHKEWSVLQKNLPETIYVRMYEDRMNLLRAVIIGAAGTPYQDGLFVFDFYLPADYPNRPPAAHYHSYGLYLNPNLYADGKICLSLLNTWRGKDSELWNPGSSNVLQVLLSIQGLVLNSKPYFNEADFDRYVGTDGGEKNSIEYNESAFILTCKSMLNLLRRPPKHLEELIKSHFRGRAGKILSTCNAYCDGVPVGACAEEFSSGNSEAPAGFKLLLLKLMPMLAAAFKAIGATGCDEFLAANQSQQEQVTQV